MMYADKVSAPMKVQTGSIGSVVIAGLVLFVTSSVCAQYRYSGAAGPIADAISGSTTDIAVTTNFGVATPNFPGQIVAARVSLYVMHPADQELSIVLVGPDSTQVPLLQNRQDAAGNINNGIGALGENLGTSCLDSGRTVFDDKASTQIPTSNAPYVGSFKPAFQFAAFDGKSGSQVNGTWHLIVTDYRHNNAGTLECWSLFLDSTDLIFLNGFELSP